MLLNKLRVIPIIDGVVYVRGNIEPSSITIYDGDVCVRNDNNHIVDGVVYIYNDISQPATSYDDLIIDISKSIYSVDGLQMVILSDFLPQFQLAFLVSELSGKYELYLLRSNVYYKILTRLRDGKVYEGNSLVQLVQRAFSYS